MAVIASPTQIAQSVQFADGRIVFDHPPQLLGARPSINSAAFLGADYHFTIAIPENAGEALQRVTFIQTSGAKPIKFNLRQTRAYLNQDIKQPTSVDEAVVDNQGIVSVSFDPPLQPGETVTIKT